ncbi:hypothetical protein GE300_21740 [Rhodobacteraceae bacterium 2CG4]|uniref:Stringent starvation protein B n=1 Tax=Halovulum marinum TaxID=2662447 RepID=A0A6L5Z7L0_9RHOB|nr:ClpXP protease specificity-enhancing factor SspB [Halovulum marinum]MSU92160.1 hypothetical protein [Halovulum marinum]
MVKRFHYGRLMHKALRGLMADVLSEVARHGLPGKHHFFITFDTTHPGVDIPDHLRARYPEEMTIVLQDWFGDLSVAGERFAVTLNFGEVPERLVVPFDSISTFVDPSVEFGLRFDAGEEPGGDETGDSPPPSSASSQSSSSASAREAEVAAEKKGGDIVSLDQFRKH